MVEVGDTTGYVECVVKAHNMLAAGAARDKCSPFLVVSRYCPPAGEWETIHRTAKLIGQVRNRRQRFSISQHFASETIRLSRVCCCCPRCCLSAGPAVAAV